MPDTLRNSDGVGLLDMASLSQIVTFEASAKYHNLCVANISRVRQNMAMTDKDKNGGPNYLRAWREFHRMSREELAQRVNTNVNMILYLEEGQRGLSLKWLRRLAPALGTTPGFLADIDPSRADTRTMELAMAIPDEKRDQVNAILETFLRNGTQG